MFAIYLRKYTSCSDRTIAIKQLYVIFIGDEETRFNIFILWDDCLWLHFVKSQPLFLNLFILLFPAKMEHWPNVGLI